MTSVSPFSSIALSLLVKVSDLTPPGRQQSDNAADNVLKTSNGVSDAPSQGLKSAASAAGKLAVDQAQERAKDVTSSADDGDGKNGKIIIGDLGTFDTFDEARAYVKDNDMFSAGEKKQWFAKLDQFEKDVNSAEEFKKSDLYKKISSGEIRALIDALKAASGATNGADTLESMKNFHIAQGQ